MMIGDTDLTSLNERDLTKLRRDRIGFVFQAFNLVPTLSALENITLPMDLAGIEPDGDWLKTVISTVGLTDRNRGTVRTNSLVDSSSESRWQGLSPVDQN